jgi:hypothetical protein
MKKLSYQEPLLELTALSLGDAIMASDGGNTGEPDNEGHIPGSGAWGGY